MLFRMICIVSVLHEPIIVDGRQGMAEIIFYEKTIAAYALRSST